MVRLEREVYCRIRKCICQEVVFYFRQKKGLEPQRLRREKDRNLEQVFPSIEQL